MKTARAKWRAPRVDGVMNATEARYVRHVLEPLRLAGEVVSWQFEPIKFKLAKATFYNIDFLVLRADGLMEVVDVKGSGPAEDDARVKWKVAAELHPAFIWVWAQETKKRGVFGREER